ncbi:hypothetical protein [Pseudolysinimonas sp.]|uniref:hypothetical protein n=1 Tax=Pseudolysinimonas sp. TaxID=2680009 RepID=UPI002869F797|nr:hypothetical protein [Pseudolysinimonas sp.]
MNSLLVVIPWIGAVVFVLAAVAVAILAIRLRQPVLALFGLLPVGFGILWLAFDLDFPEPPALPTIVALGLAALGIIGGNPLTVWVLGRAAKGDVDGGTHGGILVPDETASGAKSATRTREVLRGGTWIGYLERLAVIGAILVGRFEIIAAVIAIKGLGRFSELDAPEARERFIIGTLVSMTWAALCGALIVLPIALNA